ncbi:MAG: transporter [Candidatus Gorgyraea atricola]|nr:transporter [Candidatus Gorgyraea atricola]
MKKILYLTLFLMGIASFAYAARPLSTDDAGTVEKGFFEIENGFEYVKQDDEEYNLSFALKYGISESFHIGVELPYKFINFKESEDMDGIGDLVVSSKYNFLEDEGNLPSMSLGVSIKTETGDADKGLGTSEVDYGVNGIMSKEIGRLISHLNVGYTFVGGPGKDTSSYGLAMEYPINENLNVLGEITGETAFDGDFDDNPFSGLVGVNYAINAMVMFDLGIGFEISDASPDYTIVTGLTLGF